MANNCSNSITFSGNNEILKKIEEKFNALKSEGLNYENYHKLFESDMDMSDYDFSDDSPKWYHPDDIMFNDDNTLYINGDSAWSPVTELVGLLSEKYKVSANIIYDEQGANFAGEQSYNEKGICISEEECSYWEWQLKIGNFYDEFAYLVEDFNDFSEVNDFLYDNDIEDEVDMDKIREIWKEYHGEEDEESEDDNA